MLNAKVIWQASDSSLTKLSYYETAELTVSISALSQVWVWDYPTEEGSHPLFMDPGEEIRFRVTTETFVDCSPNVAPKIESTAADPTGSNMMEEDPDLEEKRLPYQLKASINEPGLGLLSWWK